MVDDEKMLESLMYDSLPETGFVTGGSGIFMEAMDPDTRRVWMTARPVTQKDYDDWAPEPPFQKIGCAQSSMDRAAFRHDPAGSDRPVQTGVIGGHDCIHVAVPGEMTPPAEAGLPAQIAVTKGHTLGFKAGRRVTFLNIGDAHYVETVGDAKIDSALKLPPGATLSELRLSSAWVVELPRPTTTFFWFSELGMRSFQGPVPLPTI